MNTFRFYKVKDVKTKVNKEIILSEMLSVDTSLSFYYHTNEEIKYDKDGIVISIGDKKVYTSNGNVTYAPLLSLEYGYDGNILIYFIELDDNNTEYELLYDKNNRLFSIGYYVVIYDEEGYVIDIKEDRDIVFKFKNESKGDIKTFLNRNKERFDKYQRISEEVEEELEDMRTGYFDDYKD